MFIELAPQHENVSGQEDFFIQNSFGYTNVQVQKFQNKANFFLEVDVQQGLEKKYFPSI